MVLSGIPVDLLLTENHDKIPKQRNSDTTHRCFQSLHTFYLCYSQSERHHSRNQSCGVTSLLLLLLQLSTLLQITPSWVLAVRAHIRNITGFKQQVSPHTDSCPLPSPRHPMELHQSWHLDDCHNKTTKCKLIQACILASFPVFSPSLVLLQLFSMSHF